MLECFFQAKSKVENNRKNFSFKVSVKVLENHSTAVGIFEGRLRIFNNGQNLVPDQEMSGN